MSIREETNLRRLRWDFSDVLVGWSFLIEGVGSSGCPRGKIRYWVGRVEDEDADFFPDWCLTDAGCLFSSFDIGGVSWLASRQNCIS